MAACGLGGPVRSDQGGRVRAGGPGLLRQAAWGSLGISLGLLVIAAGLLPRFTSDFGQDYAAAHGWWTGRDPNGSTVELLRSCAPELAEVFAETLRGTAMQTAHPPAATALAVPFAAFPWSKARTVWFLAGWAAVVAAWHVGRVELRTRLATVPLWAMALGLGTHEPLVFLLLSLALRYEHDRPRRAGVLLGVATALKIYPAFLFLGLLSRQKRAMLLSAALTVAVVCVAAEFCLGFGSTRKWLEYMPVNTARYVDDERNVSLVRQVRFVYPAAAPLAVACLLTVVLACPLARQLYRGASLRQLLPALLLASPLTWRYYLTLLSVQRLRAHELLGLSLPALVLLLGMLGVLPPEQIPRAVQALLVVFCQLAFLMTVFSVWYRTVVGQTAAGAVPLGERPWCTSGIAS